MQADTINELLELACQPYQRAGKFAWHFARGKLGRDPAFRGMLEKGLLSGRTSILDIGCGQGLLASWLLSARQQYESGRWPKGWPEPPQLHHVRGIELMPRDVERARESLSQHGDKVRIEVGNMCTADFGKTDAVVILDVLHYVDFPAQDDVLKRVHECLETGGVLLLRVGDAGAGLPFKISNWVDNVVTWVRGHRTLPRYCRTLTEWKAGLARNGFKVEAMPMHEGTPFANILLVCRKD